MHFQYFIWSVDVDAVYEAKSYANTSECVGLQKMIERRREVSHSLHFKLCIQILLILVE